MKQNGNNKKTGNYYIGLDVGTSSAGWAVTDIEYNILKYKGKAMWGTRLFPEANDASGRRTSRAARRRLDRRKQRLLILDTLFSEEIYKIDPDFLIRLSESDLWLEDKSVTGKYSIFNDKNYSDKEYYKEFPTIYHLRKDLVYSGEVHDIRLVYLAIHHIIKSRGHFLYDTADNGSDEILTLKESIERLSDYLEDTYNVSFCITDKNAFCDVLQSNGIGISAKKKALKSFISENYSVDSDDEINLTALAEMLSGAKIKLADLFNDETLKDGEIQSLSLSENIDEKFDMLSAQLGVRCELILQLKNVYDTAKLSQILAGNRYICDSKVNLYEKNKKDLSILKKYIKENKPEEYKKIFSLKKDKLNNYPAYSRYEKASGDYTCNQEDFCKFLLGILPKEINNNPEMERICQEIKDGIFLTKLKGTDNGLVPYQLHKRELVAILENASRYLDFLNKTDADGLSVKDKIIKTFEFRIPYYVGPISGNAKHNWAVRFAGKESDKVYPWNFEQIIDAESSSKEFIENLIGKCSYTGEKVLPKDSLLYSEYMLLNEINPLKVNGKSLPNAVKMDLLNDLFYNSTKTVTKKRINNYLVSKSLINPSDEISGIDDTIKSKLKSWNDFRQILNKTGDYDMVEDIIRAVLIFGEDKKMLKRWISNNTQGLDEEDVRHICRLKYSDWGRLSSTLLHDITCNIDGREMSIIDMLRTTDKNLMQLLSDDYGYAKKAEEHRNLLLGNNRSLSDKLDDLYISPSVRRSIRQTLKIVDEIVDIEKCAPKKIFIEMARDSSKEMKGKRTESRKSKLVELYKACKLESDVLFKQLENEDENKLRSDKLYLYYLQQGRCMYSGEAIDFESLANGENYDIDHIFPRSRVKDNSIENRVLVKSTLNREKTNEYPIKDNVRISMKPFWQMLKSKGFISDKKYERLTRNYPLTDKELSDFVARQLVETQQATKALTVVLQDVYEGTRIVFSKAGNVSDFRQQFDIIKCREVNDLHHAKDAYLNIVVGNVYCTKFTDRFFANIHNENYSLNRVFDYDVEGAWKKESTIINVKNYAKKNNAIVTRMALETKGQLYKLNPVKAGKGQLQKKKGLDIEKYGGYNSITGTYYCIAEYTNEKKKREISIVPIYLYGKELYVKNPIRYLEEIMGLSSPKVIVKTIKKDTLIEINGLRLYISGRTENRIVCEHAYQLCIGYENELYIKRLAKYVERSDLQKIELPVTEYDGITIDNNIKLYNMFIEKSKANVYSDILKNMREDMIAERQKFEKMEVLSQSKLLLQVLKAFQSNAQLPSFKLLNNKGEVAEIKKSMRLNGYNSVSIINQSATGLFESVNKVI